MKFKLQKEIFLKLIQTVQSAISTKTSLPILANILIEADKNELKLTATDLDMGISSKLNLQPEIQGAMTLPAKKLLDIIKELPDGQEISITAKKNNVFGWVRNLDDGKVETVIEGNAENVSAVVEWCHAGPANARVEDIEIKNEKFVGEFSKFDVLYK